jgi:hypothetical protein
MEMEDEGHIPFPDIDVYRRPDGTPGHRLHGKPTYKNLYLHPMSHHQQSNIHAVTATLVFRAKAICDKDILAQELEFMRTTFTESGYSSKQIQRAFHKQEKISQVYKKPYSIAILPYVQSMFGRLNRYNYKVGERSTFPPPRGERWLHQSAHSTLEYGARICHPGFNSQAAIQPKISPLM